MSTISNDEQIGRKVRFLGLGTDRATRRLTRLASAGSAAVLGIASLGGVAFAGVPEVGLGNEVLAVASEVLVSRDKGPGNNGAARGGQRKADADKGCADKKEASEK